MFWTDHGGREKLERAAMDGTGRQTLVQGRNVKGPVGITLDYVEDKVYWVDESLGTLYKMDLDGGKKTFLGYVTIFQGTLLHSVSTQANKWVPATKYGGGGGNGLATLIVASCCKNQVKLRSSGSPVSPFLKSLKDRYE